MAVGAIGGTQFADDPLHGLLLATGSPLLLCAVIKAGGRVVAARRRARSAAAATAPAPVSRR